MSPKTRASGELKEKGQLKDQGRLELTAKHRVVL